MGASASRATKAVVRSSAGVGGSPMPRSAVAALQTSNEKQEAPTSAPPGKRAGDEGAESSLELESMMLRLGGSVRTRTVEAPGARALPSPAVRAELREKRLQEAASRLRAEDLREVFRRRRDDSAAAAPLAAEYGVDAVLLERALGAASLPWLAEVTLPGLGPGTPLLKLRVATLEAKGARGSSNSIAK